MAEQGVVKWLTEEKGHGYIAREGGAMDVFFDHFSVAGSGFFALREGDRVEFDLVDGSSKPQARSVVKSGEGPLPDRSERPAPRPPSSSKIREEIERIRRWFQ